MAQDFAAYTLSYPDLAAAAQASGMDPYSFGVQHFQQYGQGEGRTVPGAEPEASPPWLEPQESSFAVPMPAGGMDFAAYTNAYPDLVAAAQASGMDPYSFGAQHYQQYGQSEGRTVPTSGMAVTNAPAPSPAPSNDIYNTMAVFGDRTAQLMPANDQFSTPYYAAYTNTGDLAAAVGVDPTQQVRLVDPTTGEVFFEGTGPDAARMAVTQANVRSGDLGKNARWAIEVKKPGEEWQEAGYESVDKKKGGLLGLIADIGLPILANVLLPGPGALWGSLQAAGGSLASSALQGRKLDDALLRAALTGGGNALLQGTSLGRDITSGLNKGLGNLTDKIGFGGTDLSTTLSPEDLALTTPGFEVMANLPNYVPGSVAPITVTSLPTLSSAATAGLAALPGTVAGLDVVASPNTPTNVTPGAAVPGLQTGQPTPVQGVEVTATQQQPPSENTPGTPLSPEDLLLTGSGTGAQTGTTETNKPGTLGTITNILSNPLVAGTILNALGGGGSKPGTINTGSAGTRGSLSPIFSAQLPNTFTVQPFRAKDMSGYSPDFWRTYGSRPEAAFGLSTAEQGPNLAWQIPGANGNWLSTESAPWGAGVEMDPKWGALSNTDVNKLLSAATGYTGKFGAGGWQDWIVRQPESVKAVAREILRKADKSDRIAFKRGGRAHDDFSIPMMRESFAVEGPGTGRSDSIPAELSDGEYVIDAETVALLGDGSNRAGAKKLDRFRANVRKHKGKALAKGKFSVNAKMPEKYLSGGRV